MLKLKDQPMHIEPKVNAALPDATFVPVNELELLLVAAMTDASARPAFYRGLLEHQLFFINEGSPPPRDVSRMAKPGETFSVRSIEFEGKLYVPIFTSENRISAVVNREVGYLGMNGRSLLEMFRTSDLMLNPGSPCGKILSKDEVEAVLSGSIFEPRSEKRTIPDGAMIQMGQPKEYPHRLVNALCERFAAMHEVAAAYLALVVIHNSDDESPHIMIGIESEGSWDRVREAVVASTRGNIDPDQYVDFIRIDDSVKPDSVGDYMQKEPSPSISAARSGLESFDVVPAQVPASLKLAA